MTQPVIIDQSTIMNFHFLNPCKFHEGLQEQVTIINNASNNTDTYGNGNGILLENSHLNQILNNTVTVEDTSISGFILFSLIIIEIFNLMMILIKHHGKIRINKEGFS